VGEVNLGRLRELAGTLRGAVRQLRELGSAPEAEFVRNPLALNSAKCLLIIAAEAALEICNHLVARRSARSLRRLHGDPGRARGVRVLPGGAPRPCRPC